ncbi:Lipase (class 3) [Butyrivibrio fibrisolvens 16/4]|nr:Lipase (class 3) [Butyrivibrio fibrisolvens 16/4]
MRKRVLRTIAAALAVSTILVNPMVAEAGSILPAGGDTNYILHTETDFKIMDMVYKIQNGETVTIENAAQMATLTKVGYADYQSAGPISITEGRMTYNTCWGTEDKEVYVVALSGTETIVENQTTTVKEDLLSGFELSNEYKTNVKNAIIDRIPAGSNIILAGHSLGGMIAQQVAADKYIKDNYEVLNTVTFGSPLIKGFTREGMVKRLGDTSDKNPFYSISSVLNIVWQYAGVNHEDGGYNGDSSAAHCDSYLREDVWGNYDCCGEKKGTTLWVQTGTRMLTLNFATTSFYTSLYGTTSVAGTSIAPKKTTAECYDLAKQAVADGYMSEDVLNQFTTFVPAINEEYVETEVSEVIESDAELVEADITEADSKVEADLVEETTDAEVDNTAVVETEAVAE